MTVIPFEKPDNQFQIGSETTFASICLMVETGDRSAFVAELREMASRRDAHAAGFLNCVAQELIEGIEFRYSTE